MFFMVFAGTKVEDRNPISGMQVGPDKLVWSNPIGVFNAPDAESACRKAANKLGYITNFFAVEGFPWGIGLMEEEEVGEFGIDKVSDVKALNSPETKTREMERSVGMRADGTWIDDDNAA